MTILLLIGSLIVGAALSVAFQETFNSARLRFSVFGRRSEFVGRFVETLPAYAAAEGLRPVRKDRVTSRQRGNRIWGQIERELPADESGKRWLFKGYVDGAILVAAFWTSTPDRDPTSYGTIIMHRASPQRWEGRYWRPGTEADAARALASGVLNANEITWEKSGR